ncbi:MAG: hypothetical protein Aurels2KO_49710 [Aureliella sp.]
MEAGTKETAVAGAKLLHASLAPPRSTIIIDTIATIFYSALQWELECDRGGYAGFDWKGKGPQL